MNQNDLVNGNFKVQYGTGIDAGGLYNEYLRLLGENLSSIFVIENNRLTSSKILRLNPVFKDLTVFNAPLLTLSYVIKLLRKKNVNIISQLELGHIVKLLIIDNLEVNISYRG